MYNFGIIRMEILCKKVNDNVNVIKKSFLH
jgi:hypothetical protein